MTRETRKYGISQVEITTRTVDEWNEATRGAGRLPFDSYFPALEWLEGEVAAAKLQADGRIFRPHTDLGWYLESILSNVIQMNSWREKGVIDEACLCAMEVGLLVMEAKLKFDWEADAIRGRRLLEGAASTRIADTMERKALMEQIMKQHGKGVRHAARVASKRYPAMGSESTFRNDFYKKPSKPSD